MLRQKDVYLSERVVTLRRFITALNKTQENHHRGYGDDSIYSEARIKHVTLAAHRLGPGVPCSLQWVLPENGQDSDPEAVLQEAAPASYRGEEQ
jgi:hypothetical protein